MSYFELKVLLKTKALGCFLFTTNRVDWNVLTDWKTSVNMELRTDKRSYGIYVYKYIGPNGSYTNADFVEFFLQCLIAWKNTISVKHTSAAV